MKGINRKRALHFLALLFLVTLSASCNRGYGCPTNFSLQDELLELVGKVVSLLL